ncbi:hypothetical protein CANINC_002449 [Pichia inconspicua]|uniref:Uncharacterized protein n=1 Tax=Pichia inconspicua TaxID=52247 RepID=A0A4T0X138_9ASCO|nr:hypothetical protein CANINC_002449 [[Candida] inconspicua]
MQPLDLTLEQIIKFSGDSPAAMAARARLLMGIKCDYFYNRVPNSGLSLRVFTENDLQMQNGSNEETQQLPTNSVQPRLN